MAARPVFRPYTHQDRDGCLAVFTTNVPRYFRDHERADFESFVDQSGCPYFVIEREGTIIGCGGYGLREPGCAADLCWGMVAAADHKQHLGEMLLLGRLNALVADPRVPAVRLATRQHTDGFYQRYGFVVAARVPDGFAPGLDSVEMRLQLTDAARKQIQSAWRDRWLPTS